MEKLVLIAVIAAIIIGPEKLPGMAAQLRTLVHQARGWIDTAKDRVRDEVGEDFDDVDWKALDPRRYDPRRIVQDALAGDQPRAPQQAREASFSAIQRIDDAFSAPTRRDEHVTGTGQSPSEGGE